ncbi:MAG: aspartyl protease family protein [Ferruginibacter sp.]
MRYFISIVYFLIVTVNVNAQEILSPQPQAQYITRFPFKQFSGGVIVVRACVENIKDTFNFVLDTGSGGISLDSSTCKEFNIATVQTDTLITGIAGVRKVHFVFNKSLKFPGLTVDNLNFHINDYDVLTSVYGEKIDGIIGYSFLSRYIIKIDYDSMLIDVYKPGEMQYPYNGTLLHPSFTSLPIQFIQVKDRRRMPFNFYLDTGAGLCFLMSERFAKDSSILLNKRKPLVTQAEGMGGMLKMRLTVVREVKVGPYRFHHVPTYLYEDDNNITSYPFTGGLIGNDLLRRFNVIFNYPKREIFIKPNTHYYDQFDYAYTGLGIYYLDGKIMVVDVIPGSPAAKAGFYVNDEIIGVGNNMSRNIQLYRSIFQSPNERLRVIIKRENELMELNIKTRSIR